MKFVEVNKPPEFTLTLSIGEAVQLWRIVNDAVDRGNEEAKYFVNALYDFAANSNDYTNYLKTSDPLEFMLDCPKSGEPCTCQKKCIYNGQ